MTVLTGSTQAAHKEHRSAWSSRGWAIYLGWVAIIVDGSALNLALPTIAKQMGAGPGAVSWVVDAYTLPLASLLLLGGSLGDRFGAENVFRIGAFGFAAASVSCALCPSIDVLLACRCAQGMFAALLLPMVLALVGKSFDDAHQRSRAVNLLTVFGGTAMAAGPFLGGLLTDSIGWRAVFWLTAPLAIAAALAVGSTDGPEKTRPRLRVDATGQVTGTAGLIALVAGLIETQNASGSTLGWLLVAAGLILLAGFVRIERRSDAPMMPLTVFRSPGFSGAVIGGFSFQFAAYGLQFFLAVYLQRAWGVSAFAGGLLLATFAVGTVLASMVVNPHLLRQGNRRMILVGTVTAAGGTIALLGATGAERWWLLIVAEFVIGAGTGIYSTALNTTASTSLGAADAGLASGIYNTARQVGQSMGVAILGALASAHASQAGFSVAVALVACCTAGIGASVLRRRPSRIPGCA